MKIKDIKNKRLRDLAIERSDCKNPKEKELVKAFNWQDTDEGWEFWLHVNKGMITSLNNVNRCFVRSKPKKEYTNIIAWLFILVACTSFYFIFK